MFAVGAVMAVEELGLVATNIVFALGALFFTAAVALRPTAREAA